MSTRRKYRTPTAHATADVAAAPAPAPPAAPDAPPDVEEPNPLQRALDAQSHAEQLQRQPARAGDVHAHIDSLPISGHKKAFLHANPALASAPLSHVMAHHYQLALHSGVPDDSEFMNQTVLQGVQRDIAHHHALKALTSADARPTPENEAAHHDIAQHVADLQREAEGHLAEYQPEPPAPPQRRRSIPMSAPVSRDAPGVSGHRGEAPGSNTLTAEERQIARHSFTDPGMSNAEKELRYLRNRQKLAKMRADGSYPERGQG